MVIGDEAVPALSLAEHLLRLAYFKALPPERGAALGRQARCRAFAPREMIFAQGEVASGLWIVESGRVKICRLSADGREHILHLLGPGESFNDIPALDGGPTQATAIALTAVTAWTLGSDALLAELRANPELALAALQILAGRQRELIQQIEDLALCSVLARLARFLLKQHANNALGAPGITRTTIAAHLATTPETVSRTLRVLEAIGALRFDRQQIIIERDDLLRSVALDAP